jgi:cell division protein FtsB
MLQKIKKLQKSTLLSSLADVRTLGMIAFAVIALLVTWSGVRVVQINYDLQKQISAMQQENDIRKLENSNLALQNEFLATDQYLELAARKQFSKGFEGEKLLIVPKSVAMKHSIEYTVDTTDTTPKIEQEGPWYERNFNAWMDFLFRSDS